MSRQIMVKNPNWEQEKVYDNQLYFMRFFVTFFYRNFHHYLTFYTHLKTSEIKESRPQYRIQRRLYYLPNSLKTVPR